MCDAAAQAQGVSRMRSRGGRACLVTAWSGAPLAPQKLPLPIFGNSEGEEVVVPFVASHMMPCLIVKSNRPDANLLVASAASRAQGPFTKKMLRRGQFAGKHFDDDVGMSFVQLDEDPVTRKPVRMESGCACAFVDAVNRLTEAAVGSGCVLLKQPCHEKDTSCGA